MTYRITPLNDNPTRHTNIINLPQAPIRAPRHAATIQIRRRTRCTPTPTINTNLWPTPRKRKRRPDAQRRGSCLRRGRGEFDGYWRIYRFKERHWEGRGGRGADCECLGGGAGPGGHAGVGGVHAELGGRIEEAGWSG